MYIRWRKIVDSEEVIKLLRTYASYLSPVMGISEEEALKRLDYFYNNGLKDLILSNPEIGETIKLLPDDCEVKLLKINLQIHQDYDFLIELIHEFRALLMFKHLHVSYLVCWKAKTITFLSIKFSVI